MYQNDIRFCFLDDGEEVTAGLFVDYGKLMLLFCWHYFVLCPKCYITSCCWVTVPGAPSSVSPDLSPSCSVSVLSSSSFSGSRVSSSSPNHGSHRCHAHSSARNTFIGPKPRDGLGDPKHSKSEALMMILQDGVSGGQAYPVLLQQAIYPLGHKSLPQFLTGWFLWGEQPSWMSPRFIPSLFFSWHLPGILFPPFLCTYSCSYVLNSQLEWAPTKILGTPPSLCLPRLSLQLLHQQAVRQVWLVAIFPLKARHPWKWTTLIFYF